jgi:anthranilate synthase/aminodeoxychorismate synthase-like glutamine amidotransferase
MRVLFLENHDSFSRNVIDRLPVRPGEVVVRDGGEAGRDPRALDGFDAVVLGPGPTDPVRAGLVGLVCEADRRRLPLLGVCLGFQAIGLAYGATLVRTHPAHGLRCTARFEPSRMFPGFDGPETVMRYHSLSLARVCPPLRVVAATEDGIPMALEHESRPIAGVQFHPDSYATPRGLDLFASFFEAIR